MVGPFYVIRGKLISIFSSVNLGDGGLVPCTMLQADLKTPLPGSHYFLNIGATKNSIDISRCEDAKRPAVDKRSGKTILKLNRTIRHGKVVLTDAALDGADLWIEETVTRELFMSDKLAQQIIEAGFAEIFDLQECQISDGPGVWRGI